MLISVLDNSTLKVRSKAKCRSWDSYGAFTHLYIDFISFNPSMKSFSSFRNAFHFIWTQLNQAGLRIFEQGWE